MNERKSGTVKWFNDGKGYGFIVPDDPGARDVFVHYTAIQAEGFKSLPEGTRVTYVLREDPRREEALDVRAEVASEVWETLNRRKA